MTVSGSRAGDQGRGLARNIELKVRCSPAFLTAVMETLTGQGIPLEELRQRDTYLRVSRGRLKLREIEGAVGQTAELIGYERPDLDGSRLSAYTRVTIQSHEVASLRTMLIGQLGELVTVAKRRTVAILGRTRVHLDTVDELGCFIELETVLRDDERALDGEAEHQGVIRHLSLGTLDTVAGSYSDLLIATRDSTATDG